MKAYFDTPVLVFACANGDDWGQLARVRLATAGAAGGAWTTPHALAEMFNTLTYRLKVPPRVADQLIAENTAKIKFADLAAADYRAALKRILASGATGDKVYDALHVIAAEKCGADEIHTSNRRDFAARKTKIPLVFLA